MRGDIAAHAIEKLDGPRAIQREPNVFEHLTIAHLHNHKRMRALARR